MRDYLFSWFGSTPLEIYSTLQAMGIKGNKGQCSMCPIAQAVQQITGREPIVLPAYIFFLDSIVDRIYLPTPVQLFIDLFDNTSRFDLVLAR